MNIVILYHPESDHSRIIEEYVHDFTKVNPEVSMKLLSVDTREGANAATTYDVTSYPAMLALKEDGGLAKLWSGLPMPLMNDVAYFTYT